MKAYYKRDDVVFIAPLVFLLVIISACAPKESTPPSPSTEAPAAAVVQTPSPAPAASSASETPPAEERQKDDVSSLVTPLAGAPPAPKGFATTAEVYAAVMSGKVAIIDKDAPVPEGVVETKDIEYGNIGGTRPLLLDLYQPATAGSELRPGLIFIHGGAWKSGNRSDYKYYTGLFAKRGYVVATISYRFSSEAKFPAAVEDAKCAVRWMRANASQYHVDPNKIAVIGGSAGGYLALMVGYTSDIPEFEGSGGNAGVSSRVQAVVDLYGPVDLTAPEGKKADVVKAFLGKTYEEDPDLYVKASPITYLTADDPPTLILQGTVDDTVPVTQSDLLARKLKELGIFYLYDRLEGWPHTMDLAKDVNDRCQFYMVEFFNKVFNGAPKSGETTSSSSK